MRGIHKPKDSCLEEQGVNGYSCQLNDTSEGSQTHLIAPTSSALANSCSPDKGDPSCDDPGAPHRVSKPQRCGPSTRHNDERSLRNRSHARLDVSGRALPGERSDSFPCVSESGPDTMVSPPTSDRDRPTDTRPCPQSRDACFRKNDDQLTPESQASGDMEGLLQQTEMLQRVNSTVWYPSEGLVPDNKHFWKHQHIKDDEQVRQTGRHASQNANSEVHGKSYFNDSPLGNSLVPHMLDQIHYDPFEDLHPLTAPQKLDSTLTFSFTNLEERWDVDRDTAAYLSTIVALSTRTQQEELIDLTQTTYDDIAMCTPVLARDPDLELRQLRHRNIARMSSSGISLYSLDAAVDEAVQWPENDMKHLQMKGQQMADERLHINKDAVKLLQSISQPDSPTGQDIEIAFSCDDKVRLITHTISVHL
nr:hypothetical protein CFP56_72379 [Quercus suber]